MNTTIEIHDSKVTNITQHDGTVIVHFLPAYLHKSEGRPGLDAGTGWVQEAQLIFSEASVRGDSPEWPCNLRGGEIIVDGHRHENSIPVPLEVTEPTELRLICDPAHTITVTGRGVRLELIGEPRLVEAFPQQ